MFRRFCQFRNGSKWMTASINNSRRYGNNWKRYKRIYPIAFAAAAVITETVNVEDNDPQTLHARYSSLKEIYKEEYHNLKEHLKVVIEDNNKYETMIDIDIHLLETAQKIAEEAMDELQEKKEEIQKLNKTVAKLEAKVKMLGVIKQYTFEAWSENVEIGDDGRKIVITNGVAASTDKYQAGSHVFEIKWTGSRVKGSENTIGITSPDGTTKYYCTYRWGGNFSHLKKTHKYQFNENSEDKQWWESGQNIIMILDFTRRRLTYIIKGELFTIEDITPGSYNVYVGASTNSGSVTFEIL